MLRLEGLTLKYDNEMKCTELLRSIITEEKEFLNEIESGISLLEKHWVENVHDLRLLIQAGMIEECGLSTKLIDWLKTELQEQHRVYMRDIAHQDKKRKISHSLQNLGIELAYDHDMDENGLFYHLGNSVENHNLPCSL